MPASPSSIRLSAMESPNARSGEQTTQARKPAETSPLLKMEPRVIPDVDFKVPSLQLTEEESQAVLQDERDSTIDIVKDELKRIFVMAVPLILTNVLELVPDSTMLVMISRSDPEHSTEVMAALGLTGLFQMLLVINIVGGLSVALETVSAQAFGGKRYVELWLAVQAGVIVFAALLPAIAIILFNGAAILRLMGQDPDISETASTILIIVLVSLPFMMVQTLQRTALQAMNITLPVAVSTAVSYAVSLPAAYVLGFHTSLGYVGVYASNIINNTVKVLVFTVVIFRNPVYREHWPGWRPQAAMQFASKIVRLGCSSLLMATFQTFGFMVVSLLVGYLPNPAIAIAANNIFNQILAFAMTPMYVFSIVGAIRMGNALGAGRTRRADVAGRTIVGLSVSVAFIGSFAVAVAPESITRIFTSDPAAVTETVKLLLQAGITVPVMGAAFGMQSGFSACGEQWVGAKLNFVFALLVGAPLSWLFAIKFNGGITGLWLGTCVGFLGVAVGSGVWLHRLNWSNMAYNARQNTHLSVDRVCSAEVA